MSRFTSSHKRWIVVLALMLAIPAMAHHRKGHQEQTIERVYENVPCGDFDILISVFRTRIVEAIMNNVEPNPKDVDDFNWWMFVRSKICRDV